ncbi:2-dehydro-3-deoxyphosphooctonate aldolase [Flavobacterium caeni]|uniref:2-dehydro-3-deoxyphosphooctonate aldolase n=1 Tax=Flavobacterium caeni TaxID=490189 RepID=A0A1G5B9X7_9FLAO|nr:2-dehydro-3-deoxyphosphooctonate aldolase [Flavobacterium caeni]SCX86984.1 hypothetical protein SAMN02927903_00304 [Flavobacterium caeni]
MKSRFVLIALAFMAASCVSTKSTLKNVDDNAPAPQLKDGAFVITQTAPDNQYGYDPDYPINVFYLNTKDDKINQQRFLNALAGPNGEHLVYNKVETCCPFPTKRNSMGVGLLDIYQITWQGNPTPIRLYFNIHEKGALMVPVGLTLKKP